MAYQRHRRMLGRRKLYGIAIATAIILGLIVSSRYLFINTTAYGELLTVTVVGNKANAYDGGTGNANLLVQVLSGRGPVKGLKRNNFIVLTMLVPPGGARVEIQDVYEYGNGIYAISVTPQKGSTWLSGDYNGQLIVKTAASIGYSLWTIERVP